MALGITIVGGPGGIVAGIFIGSILEVKWPSGNSLVDCAKDGISCVCDWEGHGFK